MKCYKRGGCGPYEMLSCKECPASKIEYLKRYRNINNNITQITKNNNKKGDTYEK